MQPQLSVPPRSTGTTYLFWFFFGAFGAHKFYLGRPFMGVLYALSLGFIGMGVFFDLFTIPAQVRRANAKLVDDTARLAPVGTMASVTDTRSAEARPLS